MTISKQELIAQLPTASKEFAAFDAIFADNDEVLPLLWNGLMAYYRAQLEKNKTLPQGETVQSMTAPSSQQQSDGKGGFFMVKSATLRVKSPVSDEVLPVFS